MINYRPGTKHSNADGLSRSRPCHECDKCEKAEIFAQCAETLPELGETCGHYDEEQIPRIDEQFCCQVTSLSQSSDKEIRDTQMQDKDIGEIMSAMEGRNERPDWGQISMQSRMAKCLWAQWDLLEIKKGMLYKGAWYIN